MSITKLNFHTDLCNFVSNQCVKYLFSKFQSNNHNFKRFSTTNQTTHNAKQNPITDIHASNVSGTFQRKNHMKIVISISIHINRLLTSIELKYYIKMEKHLNPGSMFLKGLY